MKFEARKFDLDLELVTLSGEEVNLSGPTLSGRQAGDMGQRFNQGGIDFDALPPEERTPMAAAAVFTEQLAEAYPGTTGAWWIDNFDIGTIKEIRAHVITVLLGLEKRGPVS